MSRNQLCIRARIRRDGKLPVSEYMCIALTDPDHGFRLSSKSHWDVPLSIGGRTVHFLVSHPTPPVFDDPPFFPAGVDWSSDDLAVVQRDEEQLLADARSAGLDGLVPVISNGSDAPGTLLPDCSPAFLDIFHRADLIIAKQRNGPIGDFKLVFRNDITKFFNYAPEPEFMN